MSLGVIDIIVLAGAAAMTFGLVAMMRSASGYVQIHAVSLVAMSGAAATVCAAIATGDGPLITKALLVGGFLLLTTPLSSHALCRLESAQDRPGPPKS